MQSFREFVEAVMMSMTPQQKAYETVRIIEKLLANNPKLTYSELIRWNEEHHKVIHFLRFANKVWAKTNVLMNDTPITDIIEGYKRYINVVR